MIVRLPFLSVILPLAACADEPDTTPSAAPGPVAGVPAAWGQCATCHALASGRNGIGPSLEGVHGRAAAQEPSYAYSSAMRASGIVWDDASLDAYLADPREVVPGTKMAFAGIADPAARAELIDWLERQ